MPPKAILPKVRPTLIPSAMGAMYDDGTPYEPIQVVAQNEIIPKERRELEMQSAEDMLPKIQFTPQDLLAQNTNNLVDRKTPSLVNPDGTVSDPTVLLDQPGKYDDMARKAADMYGMPYDLIKGMIQQESSGNSNAKSPKGAAGLMQLMPATAKELGVTDPYDPQQNINAGTKYLSQLYKQFGNWRQAIQAYNAGPGNVRKYSKKGQDVPFPETIKYLKKLLPLVEKKGKK